MSNHFQRRPTGPKLAPLEAERQGRISQLAFLLLGRADAIAFLNDHNSVLNGRPLDLAIASDEGFRSVEQQLRRIAAP